MDKDCTFVIEFNHPFRVSRAELLDIIQREFPNSRDLEVGECRDHYEDIDWYEPTHKDASNP